MSLSFQLVAIVILIAFYALYLLKWFQQRKLGVKGNAVTMDTFKDTRSALELIMKASVILTTAVQLASIFLADYLGTPLPLPDWAVLIVRCIGAAVGVLAVFVFWLAIRAMKKNWRVGIDRTGGTKLVTKGIYALSRNPAFLAFDLLFISILLMFYNQALLVSSIFSAIMLHIQILQEERWLKKAFGDAYIDYKSRVRRYYGKIRRRG